MLYEQEPPLTLDMDNARETHLFGVLRDQWAKLKDSLSEMSVWALHNMGVSHIWLQGDSGSAQDSCDRVPLQMSDTCLFQVHGLLTKKV